MTEQSPIRVVLIDDDPAFRLGLRQLLQAEPDMVIVGEGENGGDALRAVEQLRPDILLLDVLMPELGGMEVLDRLAAQDLPTRSILVTGGGRCGCGDDRELTKEHVQVRVGSVSTSVR